MQKRILIPILGCLNLLLVFLVCFDDLLTLPAFLQWSGRLHPMLLHFPLALMVITSLIYLLFPAQRSNPAFDIVFLFSSFTAVISALTGLFLSQGGEYDLSLLRPHMWLGTGISIIAYLILYLRNTPTAKTFLMIIALPLLIIGGHYGATLTHGENYLGWPDNNTTTSQPAITDSSRVYAALIEPILSSKCYSCHNDKKAKGELVMTSLRQLLKGGKNGPVWIAGDPLNSHILQRLDLPEEDKKHMPPRGKTQVTEKEKELLEAWIAAGADTLKRIADYPDTDPFRTLMASFMPRNKGPQYTVPAADPALIRKLATPFCDISPIAEGSPALAVRFIVRSGFSPQQLKALAELKEQIVYMNLANMPLKDEDLASLSVFKNLETLIISGTNIRGDGLPKLSSLPKLRRLSLSSTPVTAQQLKALAGSPSIQTIYCWNTRVQPEDSSTLRSFNARIHWELGNRNDPAEMVRLTPPQAKDLDSLILGPGRSLTLKHPMPGVQIRYTLDGSVPDSSLSPLYRTPLQINKACRLRAIATRPGWLTSDTTDITLFLRSARPQYAILLSKPDSNYKLNGIYSLLDEKKGEMNNIRENWLGFHGVPCEARFTFAEPTAFREVVVSTLKKTGPHILPPQRIELWAGNDSLRLQKISSITPLQPQKYEADKIEAQALPNNGSYKYYMIKAYPVPALPKWHESKGKKVWIFIDEVFFN